MYIWFTGGLIGIRQSLNILKGNKKQ